jgi:hypothetical protein
MNLKIVFKINQWACCDLNASLWLPKPQGYQATPQALGSLAKQKEKTDKRVFGAIKLGSQIFQAFSEVLVFLG